MSAAPSHFVFESSAWWGNARPLIALALNLLAHHDGIHVTFVLPEANVERTLIEMKRFKLSEDKLERFHALANGEDEEFVDLKTVSTFSVVYKSLLQGERVWDARTMTWKSSLPLPSHVVGESILLHILHAQKVKVETEVFGTEGLRKIFLLSVWSPSPSFASFAMLKDSIMKDQIYEGVKILKSEGNEKTEAEVWTQLIAQNTDRIQINDRINIYGYEAEPSACPSMPGWSSMFADLLDLHLSSSVDGLILTSTKDLEDPLFEERALKTYKRVWLAGIQLPEVGWSTELEDPGESTEERNSREVQAFLDSASKEHGEQSVLFISFGSTWQPATTENLTILFETLNSLEIPFLMAEGTADEERKALIARHVALSIPWVAQQAVLAHKSISAFLTHCGAGSTNECLIRGVPMICWPGTQDQPLIAIELTQVHRVAVELMQVRVDFNIGRPTTRGISIVGTPQAVRVEMLDVFGRLKANSPEFGAMRERLVELKKVMVQSKETGFSYQAMGDIGRLR